MDTTERQRGLTDIEAGKLIADVEHIKVGQERQEEAQKKQQETMDLILRKMDDRITRKDLENFRAERQRQTDERYVSRREIEGLVRLWSFLTTDFMKLLSKVILWGAVIMLTFSVLKNLPEWVYHTQNKAIHKSKEG